MNGTGVPSTHDLAERLREAEATIRALLSGEIDAVVDSKSNTPVLLTKAQAALRESEERYRRIVETASEGIWTTDTEFKLTFVNRPLTEMLGHPADEMLGQSLFRFVPLHAGAIAALRFERSRQGVSEENEVEFVRKDGSELWALLKTSPIRDNDGNYVGTLAMMTDRTRHRQDEEALRKSEEQYRQIVEATTDGIIKINVEGNIVFVNRRFTEMLGYQPQEMNGKSVFAFMSAAARLVAADAFQKGSGAIKDAVDTTLRHKDGTDIAVNLAGTPLLDGNGLHVGNLAVVRDVTERKKLQSQLMVSDRMASVGTLAAGVAHEINNPLAAVVANLDFIAEAMERWTATESDPVSPAPGIDVRLREEIKAPLDDAREAAERVRFIVRDLKIFSRSPLDEPRGPVDVRAIMETSLRMAWNEIRHRARLVKQYSPVPGVVANEARLGQVFLNLVVNAAQALQEGRAEQNEIRVSARLDGNQVLVEVSDTGAGIPPEIIGRVFDAFFTTKAVGSGTGLGLAICQRIVTDMGGQLTVESEVGRGTTFRVALPVSSLPASSIPSPTEEVVVANRRGRILVVDDETLVLRVVERVLSSQHDVVTLASAKSALTLCARGEKFDLIICDLMMPDMTGMDLHRELLLVAPDQAKQMIFLTGGAFTSAAKRFLADTGRAHIDKPFDPPKLRTVVQRHLR